MEKDLCGIIIEDNRMVAKHLERECERFPGVKIIGNYENCYDAFSILHQESLHFILLDMELPGIHGKDFLNEIELNIPIIITSDYENYAVEMKNKNVLAYIKKPVAPKNLLGIFSKIKSLQSDHKQLQDNHNKKIPFLRDTDSSENTLIIKMENKEEKPTPIFRNVLSKW